MSPRTMLTLRLQKYGWRRTLERTPAAVRRRVQKRRELLAMVASGEHPGGRTLPEVGGLAEIVEAHGLSDERMIVIDDPDSAPQLARKHTTDFPTYGEVHYRREYDFAYGRPPETIIDLGANVGYTAVYFHHRFPAAQIVSVEPDAGNARVARANIELGTAPGKVELYETAVWHRHTWLRIINPTRTQRGFRVAEASPDDKGAFEAMTVAEIMQRAGFDRVDLLKVDVEGTERTLFAENTEWLDAVRMLVIELHDRFIPDCEKTVTDALDRHWGGYREVKNAYNTFYVRA